MYLTESELRELWRDGRGILPRFPPGTRLSPSARDFLNTHGLQIDTAPEPAPIDPGQAAPEAPAPVAFRARMDSLHAAALLVGAQARRFNLPELAGLLNLVAADCREIMSAEYNERGVGELAIAEKAEAELAAISGSPDRRPDLPPPVPGPEDHEILLWLNWLRAAVREAELAANQTFARPDHPEDPRGLAHALNRMSGAVRYLELLFRSGKLAWRLEVRSQRSEVGSRRSEAGLSDF